MWSLRLNAVLASVAVTVGFWLIWEALPVSLAVLTALVVAGFLVWKSETTGTVWAWATLCLGIESLAWPLVTMVQVRMTASEPTEQQMGSILVAMLFGLFSAIFWTTFAYGLFKRTKKQMEEFDVRARPEVERARNRTEKKKS